jgi:hypothetical protein
MFNASGKKEVAMRICFVALFLLVAPVLVSQESSSWLNGTWEGVGFQGSDSSTWTIRFIGDSRSGSYRIDYVSLECGGVWKPEHIDGNRAVFREVLSYGKNMCANGGRVVLTRINRKYITFSWFQPGTGKLDAWSTLVRTK